MKRYPTYRTKREKRQNREPEFENLREDRTLAMIGIGAIFAVIVGAIWLAGKLWALAWS